jgi:hypothetical protein
VCEKVSYLTGLAGRWWAILSVFWYKRAAPLQGEQGHREAKPPNVNVTPDKGRGTTGEGRINGRTPSEQPWQVNVPTGPSIRVAKWFTLPAIPASEGCYPLVSRDTYAGVTSEGEGGGGPSRGGGASIGAPSGWVKARHGERSEPRPEHRPPEAAVLVPRSSDRRERAPFLEAPGRWGR